MTDLRISSDLKLPIDVAGEALGILATRGAGKSYTSAVLVEELWKAKVQVAVLDPTGVFWGLRASSDGKDDGLPIFVLGGQHGDLPLEETAGALIANLLVDTGQSLILDLSDFPTKGAQTRFVTDFAERLYRRKARERSTLHLVIDESDEFAPQRPMRDEARMVGAMEVIVRRGRSRGLGSTLITQRSAALNKNVLDVIDTLVAMRIGSPRDRKAVESWITVKNVRDELGVLESLPGLPTGTAWVWSPVRGLLEKTAVRRIRTFDSYATPKPGERRVEPAALTPIDLDKLGEQMEATKERAKADDPKELRRQIAALKKELSARPTVAEGKAEKVIETVEVPVEVKVPVLPDDDILFLRDGLKEAFNSAAALDEVAGRLDALVAKADDVLERAWKGLPAEPATGRGAAAPRFTKLRPPPTSAQVTDEVRRQMARPRPSVPDPPPDVDVVVKAGAKRMLEVLARQHPMRLSRAALGMAAKVKRTGGTFSTYFGVLKNAGLIVEDVSGLVGVTEAGMDFLGVDPPPPLSADELRAMYRERLKAGARRMFDLIVEAYPQGLTREELGERAAITMTGGTFSTYLGHLRVNELVAEYGGEVFASDWLFEEPA